MTFLPGDQVRFVTRPSKDMSRADARLMRLEQVTIQRVTTWTGVGTLVTLQEDETQAYWNACWFRKARPSGPGVKVEA